MSYALNTLSSIHGKLIFTRRAIQISRSIINHLPACHSLLDVGCGDGSITMRVADSNKTMKTEGVDILIRPHVNFPVSLFDGSTLPFKDSSWDTVMLIDVLHHSTDPEKLLLEAVRVARKYIIIKDHFCESGWQRLKLKLMDWVGNRAHGVVLPYNYLCRKKWSSIWESAGLRCNFITENLDLYPYPFKIIFENGLHFHAVLSKSEESISCQS